MMVNKPRYPLINAKVKELITRSRVAKAPVPVGLIAELCGARIVENEFDGEISGVLVRKPGNVVIGVEKTQSKQRQRFTIAHELGHLLLHEGAEVHFDRNFRVNLRSPISSKAEDVAEIEANAFAASLLMPISFLLSDLRDKTIDLENEIQIGSLADRYEVSAQAMTYRLISIFSAPRARL
jgi:Zn-dependent peptidase ImmA (M78 family)